MDQPFIDQDYYQEDNYNQNQIEIITTNVNSISPPTPAYDSLQNMDEIIDKPSIDSDIQISTNQKPDNPQQDIGAPSIQGQSPSQGVASPVYCKYSSPYTTKYVVPSEFQSEYKYEQYKNISDIPNKGIHQTNENTFHISTGCCSKIVPFIFFLGGSVEISISFFVTNRIDVIMIMCIFGLCFISIGMVLFC